MFGPEIGSQVEVRELALEGITGEWDETEGNRIMIMTGVKPDDHITHSIAHSTQVVLEQTDEGADAAIKSEDALQLYGTNFKAFASRGTLSLEASD